MFFRNIAGETETEKNWVNHVKESRVKHQEARSIEAEDRKSIKIRVSFTIIYLFYYYTHYSLNKQLINLYKATVFLNFKKHQLLFRSFS